MSAADFPHDEAQRLETLASLQILDTPPDEVLTGLARIAGTVVNCPIALVSLVDTNRQWFKAAVGFALLQTPRDVSFCAHAILGDGILEVPDATLDRRFADNPLVTGPPHIRFYAGVPLDVDGRKVGTLCVIDRVAKRLDEVQRGALVDLGHAVAQWAKSWRQQNELREAEAYRRSLFDRLGDGVMLLDLEHRILDANPHATQLLGYERAELLQMRGHDVVADFERHRLDAPHTAGKVDGRRMAEWELVHKDGHALPVEVNVRRLDQTRYLAVVRDIAQRRSRERLLQQLSHAVEQSVESVVFITLDHRIEYVNEAATVLFGYSRYELIGRSPQMLRSGETPQATYDELYADISVGRSWRGLLSCRRKDGSVYLQSTVMSPIRGPDGRITHTFASLEDVTEKQRTSDELDRYRYRLEELVEERTAELEVAKQAAEAASNAKSDFLLTMSHEIRTPMNGVIGIVDVLRQSSLTPYQADLAVTIRESAFALLSVIDDTLDFSKIEAGRLVLESESTCLLHLVEGVCDSLQPIASSRNVRLQVFVDPLLPEYILTDPVRLRQILNNLVGNAIKFSGAQERQGRVRVSVAPAASGGMCLKVADNGIGMDSEVRSRIFQPFVQAESSTTRRFGGTGLGLSICRRLATLFAGSIDLTSAPGKGSCFSVHLPLHADGGRAAPSTRLLPSVDCHLVLADGEQSDDWSSYLVAAGASATRWAGVKALRDGLVRRAGRATVLVVDEDVSRGLANWVATADDGRPLATLRAGRGQRRAPRLVRPGEVSMEGDALRRDALLHAVALALGNAEPEVDPVAAVAPRAAIQSADEAARQGRLLLVAEDNEINQKVVRRQLALLGFAAVVVADGIAALREWRTGRYGLLLTDLHMPGIDGHELTRAIRSEEGPERRIPILALTANALPGEAERCLGAGMDAYLAKPVQLDQLAAALDRWLPAPTSIAPTEREPMPPVRRTALPVLDGAVLRHLIGDDPALIAELRHGFLVSARTSNAEVVAAVAAADWERVRAVAHRLKSSASAVGALALAERCEHLEQACRSCDARVALDAVTAFDMATACVVAALTMDAVPVKALREAKIYAPHEVRGGIEAGQLLLHYQPKVSLSTGALVGVEALVRWNHPLDGMLHPISFLPVAETHGLIDQLTRTVMTMALGDARRWRDAGRELRVSVNVSMDNLKRVDFVESLLFEIDRHGLRPDDLILEVTESRLMREARVHMDTLTRLRLRKIGLSIDDFGTGQSSSSRLRDLPFDELKIDRGFVHGSGDRPAERAIFTASLELAHQLGMTAVAEGVEDRADWDFAAAAGCDFAQGYFIARPMPADDLAQWAVEWQRSFETL